MPNFYIQALNLRDKTLRYAHFSVGKFVDVGKYACVKVLTNTMCALLYYISLLSLTWNIDDQYRNSNINNRGHLGQLGQLTRFLKGCGGSNFVVEIFQWLKMSTVRVFDRSVSKQRLSSNYLKLSDESRELFSRRKFSQNAAGSLCWRKKQKYAFCQYDRMLKCFTWLTGKVRVCTAAAFPGK